MKKLLVGMIALVFVAGLAGCAALGIGGEPAPKLTVVTPKVALSKKATVELKGENFKPDQEVALLFIDANGVMSDINFTVDPQPVADENGSWTTTWDCSRFISRKLIKAGTQVIKAADVDYNVLAEASITFYAAD